MEICNVHHHGRHNALSPITLSRAANPFRARIVSLFNFRGACRSHQIAIYPWWNDANAIGQEHQDLLAVSWVIYTVGYGSSLEYGGEQFGIVAPATEAELGRNILLRTDRPRIRVAFVTAWSQLGKRPIVAAERYLSLSKQWMVDDGKLDMCKRRKTSN